MMTIAQTKQTAKAQGFSLRWLPDTREFRVNLHHGTKDSAYYTNDSDDALATGRAMVAADDKLAYVHGRTQ